MPWSLLAFYKNGAKNGYTALVPVSDVTQYIIDATNYAKFSRPGKIGYACFRTSAIANFVSGRLRKTTMRDYVSMHIGIDQTRQLKGNDFLPIDIDITADDLVEAQADNGNNAQIEACFMTFGDAQFFNSVPPGAKPYTFSASGTLSAGAWSDVGTITWGKTFNKDKIYQVVGLSGHSATAYALRLVYSNHNWRPGVLAGDNAQLCAEYFADFGSFKGNSPPSIEFLSSGADTAEYGTIWLIEK